MALISEAIKFLEIKNIFFETDGGITTIINPIEFSTSFLLVNSSAKLPPFGKIVVVTNTAEYKIDVKAIFDKYNVYKLYLVSSLPEDLSLKIKDLNYISAESEKRKEERYEIGLENWEKFGLLKPECCIQVHGEKIKCVISNASIHGVLLIGSRSFITIGQPVVFTCQFHLLHKISQQAVLVTSENLTKSYFKYALQFIDPVSIYWKKQIITYSKLKK